MPRLSDFRARIKLFVCVNPDNLYSVIEGVMSCSTVCRILRGACRYSTRYSVLRTPYTTASAWSVGYVSCCRCHNSEREYIIEYDRWMKNRWNPTPQINSMKLIDNLVDMKFRDISGWLYSVLLLSLGIPTSISILSIQHLHGTLHRLPYYYCTQSPSYSILLSCATSVAEADPHPWASRQEERAVYKLFWTRALLIGKTP